jgi:hypothetical protein
MSKSQSQTVQEQSVEAGWEVGREKYNEAMSSVHAPSSIILGMGEMETVSLGVQRDEIELVTYDRCKIVGGKDGETFNIVRETEHLVVIQAIPGLMFTGDLRHAGVRNVSESDLVESFTEKLTEIMGDKELSRTVLRAIVDMLCEFKGLNRICRLHCSTRLLDSKMRIPVNTIGFTECLPNSPKGEIELLHPNKFHLTAEDVNQLGQDAKRHFPESRTFDNYEQLHELVSVFAKKWRFNVHRHGMNIRCNFSSDTGVKAMYGQSPDTVQNHCPWRIGFFRVGPLLQVKISSKCCYKHTCHPGSISQFDAWRPQIRRSGK